MKKGVKISCFFVLLAILLLPLVLSDSADDEIKKLTYQAKEYETGNINYAQFLIYSSNIREKLNEILGAAGRDYGGLLKRDQIKSILGDATKESKWVWDEKKQKEVKLEEEVPVWEKIVFDGSKIRLKLNAYPSIFSTRKEENSDNLEILEGNLVYRLNFWVEFKKEGEEVNIKKEMAKIQSLAEGYSLDASKDNAEELAEKSVSVERAFETSFRQSPKNCENFMNSIFGSENKRAAQKMLVQEIEFYSGKNFEAIARIEMCDDCEWNWINLDFWIEGRGPGFSIKEEPAEYDPEKYKGMNRGELEEDIRKSVEEIKELLEKGELEEAMSKKSEIRAMNEAWNQLSNDVWKDVDKMFEEERKSMEQAENQEQYWWIRFEQRKTEKVREIQMDNYETKRRFYSDLFSGYEIRDFYFEQTEWEKRLVELFTEKGQEICDNNIDDNTNEKVDCEDEQCGGRICGEQTSSVLEENETKEITTKLYCIEKVCKPKEQINVTQNIVCGNHICEGNESLENCSDCTGCSVYNATECSGKLIFKGKDEKGCNLEPVCLEENLSCTLDEDCIQPLCGVARCIEGSCTTESLQDCKEKECEDWQNKVKKCDSGDELIISICEQNIWKETGINCEIGENKTEEIVENKTEEKEEVIEQEVKGDECVVKDDCGNEDDVCSNGKCITIPKKESREEENKDQEEGEEEAAREKEKQEEENSGEANTITGNVIKSLGRVVGYVINGFEIQEGGDDATEENSGDDSGGDDSVEETIEEEGDDSQDEEREGEDEEDRREQEREDEEEREREDQERRAQEDEERCNNECERGCNDRLINPCVSDCVRKENCKDQSCVNEKIKECEASCKNEISIDKCKEECLDMCKSGKMEEWWEQGREEQKNIMEKGVFKAGGSCRTSQGKTDGFIWFDGWGDPFQNIQKYKQKYYSGGNADWCKIELENLKQQREEFEKSFNQEFVKWFFENYLANSAEDWEQHVSGIYEIYWRDVDIIRETIYRKKCLEENDMNEYNLIENISYSTDYGTLEFWEERKTVKMDELGGEEIEVVSPYMKIWIFPPKEFIQYELKKAMKNQEFPGSSEDKLERGNEQGLKQEEKDKIRKDSGFMKTIKKVADNYGGNMKVGLEFTDSNKNVIFNLYADINEQDIINVRPMLPEEMPGKDVTINMNFEKLYEIIYTSEKEMRETRIESPPWDKKQEKLGDKIKDMKNGIKMFFKIRSMINSAEITPKEAEKDVRKLLSSFVKMMIKQSMKGGEEPSEEDQKDEKVEDAEAEVLEQKEALTGQIILDY